MIKNIFPFFWKYFMILHKHKYYFNEIHSIQRGLDAGK
jgi:hypothetical protein